MIRSGDKLHFWPVLAKPCHSKKGAEEDGLQFVGVLRGKLPGKEGCLLRSAFLNCYHGKKRARFVARFHTANQVGSARKSILASLANRKKISLQSKFLSSTSIVSSNLK